MKKQRFHRGIPVVILALVALAMLLAGCPNPFGGETYNVAYHGNAADASPSDYTDPISYREGQTVHVLGEGTFYRPGNSLVAWNTASDGSGESYAPFGTFTIGAADVDLYAQWSSAPTYTVSYDGNGHTDGDPPVDLNTYQQGATVTVAAPGSMTRSGNTFLIWNTADDGSGLSRAPGATFTMPASNVTLYALWSSAPTYTVTYHGNGYDTGTVPVDSTNYAEGATVTVAEPGTMDLTGYTFTGWNTQANGSGVVHAAGSTLSMPAGNVDLYAQWSLTPTYTVTYDANGGGGAAPVDSIEYEAGDLVTVLDQGSLTMSGNTFTGWNTQAGGGGTARAPSSTFTMGTSDVTLYAQWTALPTYSVTYYGNGNDGGTAPTDATAYLEGATVTVAGPSDLYRDGFEFDGWNTQANGSGLDRAPASTFSMPAGDVDLYARWVPVYTVTYHANGGSGIPPSDTGAYREGESVTILGAGSLTRTSYTFVGWNTADDGSGDNYSPTATMTMPASDVTLYARWSLNPVYNVTYEENGGAGAAPEDTNNYEEGQTVTVLGIGTMSRTGFAFLGWALADDATVADYVATDTFDMPGSAVTLYAVWSALPTYTVTYTDTNGATGSPPTDANNYLEGATVTVLGQNTLALDGYTFAGWNTVDNGSGDGFVATDTFGMPANNVTLYAQWDLIPTYTVTYYANGGIGDAPVDTNDYTEGQTVTLAGQGLLSWAGHTFEGWNTQADGLGTHYDVPGSFTMGPANVDLYAEWLLIPTWNVIYDGNGADSGVPSDTNDYIEGATVTVLGQGSMVRGGYTFDNWNTDEFGGGMPYVENDEFDMPASDVTLYAQWTPIPTYTVTYDGNGSNGGTVPSDTNEYTEGQTVVVSGPGTMTQTGYEFSGWNTLPNGLGAPYAAGANMTMPADDVTLYAQWTPVYSVTYDANGGTGDPPVDSTVYFGGETVTVLGQGMLTQTHFTFGGWNTESDGTGTPYVETNTFTMPEADVTLYAQWAPEPTYNVFYDGNGSDGGTVPSDATEYYEGELATVLGPGTMTQTGHAFVEWNTESDGSGTPYATGVSLTMPAADVTLYAQWTVAYYVTYDGNGADSGSVPTDNTPYPSGATVSVAGNTGGLALAGYEFAGWNTADDGTGVGYQSDDTFSMGAADMTLYADWNEVIFSGLTYQGAMYWDSGAPESGYGVDVSGNFVYVAAYTSGVKIFDVSSGDLVPASWFETSIAYDIDVSDGYAYVAMATSGVGVYDVSDPTNPGYVTTIYNSDVSSVRNMAITGSTLWISTTTGRLTSYDISTPASPSYLDSLSTGTDNYGVSSDGTYVYIAALSNGLIIVDATNPSDLQSVPGGQYIAPDPYFSAHTVAYSDGVAYLGDGGDMYAIDVTDPANPQLAGSASGGGDAIVVAGQYLYMDGSANLSVFDISVLSTVSPPELSPVTSVHLSGTTDSPRSMALAGGRLYANGIFEGISVFDLTDPAAPVLDTWYNFQRIVTGSVLDSTTLYCVTGSDSPNYSRGGTLEVYDITDPTTPAPLVVMDLPENPCSAALDGTVLHIGYRYGMLTYDVTNPSGPSPLGTYENFSYNGVIQTMFDGQYAYLAGGTAGLRVLDVSDPTDLTEVGHYDVSGTYEAISVDGTYAYCAVMGSFTSGWVDVIDVSDPSAPTLANTITMPDQTHDVQVAGTQLWVAYEDGFAVYDLGTSPTDPDLVATSTITDSSPKLLVDRGFVYVADGFEGFYVYDSTDISTSIDSYTEPEQCRGVLVQDELLVLVTTDDPTGFVVFTIR